MGRDCAVCGDPCPPSRTKPSRTCGKHSCKLALKRANAKAPRKRTGATSAVECASCPEKPVTGSYCGPDCARYKREHGWAWTEAQKAAQSELLKSADLQDDGDDGVWNVGWTYWDDPKGNSRAEQYRGRDLDGSFDHPDWNPDGERGMDVGQTNSPIPAACGRANPPSAVPAAKTLGGWEIVTAADYGLSLETRYRSINPAEENPGAPVVTIVGRDTLSCADCGKEWRGYTIRHCHSCHELFESDSALDRHRGRGEKCQDSITWQLDECLSLRDGVWCCDQLVPFGHWRISMECWLDGASAGANSATGYIPKGKAKKAQDGIGRRDQRPEAA